jgi:hypothetical protein
MKKLFKSIPVIVFALLVGAVSAQKAKPATLEVPKMPMDEETKLVTYGGVIEENASKNELYKRAINFFVANYKNPADVLKKQDEGAGEIEGIARFKIFNPEGKDGIKTEAGLVSYSINMKFKDGRYKYEFTKINWKSNSYFGIEKWMDKNSPSYQPNYDFYLIQTDEQIRELEGKLKEAMKVPSEKEKKSDW